MAEVEAEGGAVAAIEHGFVQDQIAESAYRWEQAVQGGEQRIVGVNYQRDKVEAATPLHHIDRARVRAQVERTRAFKAAQDAQLVGAALARVRHAADASDNLLPLMRDALRAGATLGQICDTLRAVWGEYRPTV